MFKATSRKWIIADVAVAIVFLYIVLFVVTGDPLLVSGLIDATKENRAKADLAKIEQALWQYAKRLGSFPDSLTLLVKAEDGSRFLDEELLTDPWSQEYAYEPSNIGTGILIYSKGAPRKNKPIENWVDMTGK